MEVNNISCVPLEKREARETIDSDMNYSYSLWLGKAAAAGQFYYDFFTICTLISTLNPNPHMTHNNNKGWVRCMQQSRR